MTRTGSRLMTTYERTLWKTMELLGITESIERKVLTAIVLQFLATVAIFLLPFFVSGVVFFVLAAVLFVLAAAAAANTVLVVRRDFITPVLDLEATATQMAQGDIDVQAEQSDQPDEIGSLQNAFVDLRSSSIPWDARPMRSHASSSTTRYSTRTSPASSANRCLG
ncbi:HAMP domain-containing protein [Halovenus salina]|uniref:HAMP domain-containing protein n=1 Tax=Halovenus salina TaxID=1510225 RepID=A0ABD5W773_9EURY